LLQWDIRILLAAAQLVQIPQAAETDQHILCWSCRRHR
jgi:hypothetical protein